MMVSVWLFLGFILGILSVLAVEGLVILFVIKKLSQRAKSDEISAIDTPPNPLGPHQSLHSLYQKQGVLWVLEPKIVPKGLFASDQARKKEILEVSPLRKVAKIKDRTLILTETDGSLTKVLLKGCEVVAVSAASLPTKKWAKRFPIKVESKNAALYHGSKVLYIYAETSWDKESWCRALRLASSDDKERLLWVSKLSEEFRCYLKSLAVGYPSLMKPYVGYHRGPLDKVNHMEDSPSKVRQFWRKLSRKGSPIQDEKKAYDKAPSPQDPSSIPGFVQTVAGKIPAEVGEDSSSVSSGASIRSRDSSHANEMSDAEAPEKLVVDEGTLCWNLLISRLFFDVKNNLDIKTSLKARIQRTLSNMRTPSYLGEVTCTDIDPGSLPPYIHGMRAIPTDMNDLWALEMDIEYSGGVVLYIEVRLEVGELDSHNGVVDQNNESSSVGEVTTDLLDDFKHLHEELKLSADSKDQLDTEDHKFDKLHSSKIGVSTSAPGSRWKALLNSVAKQVSQVPLALAIRVATLKGTIQLHVKPPPSDQLWFGFTSMPDIQFQLESSVKDHKITSGRIASFLINRFKASIRETLVLPNCESACLSWMLAEKDDWIPRTSAPLMWLGHESPADTATSKEVSKYQPSKPKTGDSDLESKQGKQKNVDSVKQPISEDKGQIVSYSPLRRSSSESSSLPDDLKVPLLQGGEVHGLTIQRRDETSDRHSPSRYVSLKEERNGIEDDDGKPKRPGRRSRMLDLGKKMSEKIEEKRRHIEEKGRHMVEKMRAP